MSASKSLCKLQVHLFFSRRVACIISIFRLPWVWSMAQVRLRFLSYVFLCYIWYALCSSKQGTKLPADACLIGSVRRPPREVQALITVIDHSFACTLGDMLLAAHPAQDFGPRNYDPEQCNGHTFANALVAWLGCFSVGNMLFATDVYDAKRLNARSSVVSCRPLPSAPVPLPPSPPPRREPDNTVPRYPAL